MFPAPRVLAIDDDESDLRGLTEGLSRHGVACLPVHFSGDDEDVGAYPLVRVIFVDLNLVESGSAGNDHTRDFGVISGLLNETIKPAGPYVVILWTKYPDHADELATHLRERLTDVPAPVDVRSLDKIEYLDDQGKLAEPELLSEAIQEIVDALPALGALFSWEDHVLRAAGDAVSSLVELIVSSSADADINEDLGRLLLALGVAAVGKSHVAGDRFGAVNEGLLPVLADRIATMRGDDEQLWKAAIGDGDPEISREHAAKLNYLLHIASPASEASGADRGAVVGLPEDLSGDSFVKTFGLASECAAWKQFWSKTPSECMWVLVQTQAACDYAQAQAGPLPFHLGVILSSDGVRKGTTPAALWCSSDFEHDGQSCVLHVNARFQVSLPEERAKQLSPIFRLREQLLNDLTYRIHSYGARPGIISLHAK